MWSNKEEQRPERTEGEGGEEETNFRQILIDIFYGGVRTPG